MRQARYSQGSLTWLLGFLWQVRCVWAIMNFSPRRSKYDLHNDTSTRSWVSSSQHRTTTTPSSNANYNLGQVVSAACQIVGNDNPLHLVAEAWNDAPLEIRILPTGQTAKLQNCFYRKADAGARCPTYVAILFSKQWEIAHALCEQNIVVPKLKRP